MFNIRAANKKLQEEIWLKSMGFGHVRFKETFLGKKELEETPADNELN